MFRPILILASFTAFFLVGNGHCAAVDTPLRPRLVGDPWPVAASPDLGDLTGEKQQVVDFGIWQAGDGSWQIWSCIRGTKEPGQSRLFYRWQGEKLTDPNWKPMGIAMHADASFGETPGGLQAPFVFRNAGRWEMFYGGWDAIFAASSDDGKTFTRRATAAAPKPLFPDQKKNPRDPMVLRINDVWHCYYTAHPQNNGAVYCRTSSDLIAWSKPQVVARGGQAGIGPYSCECPFVVEVEPGVFFLLRTQRYGADAQTSVYRSADPMDFGIDRDEGHWVGTLPIAAPEVIRHEGQYYVACLLPSLQGIQIARLEWTAAQ